MIVGEVMKNRRNIIIVFVILLAIGFSAVSTTLVLNGLIGIGENKDDFDVVFTNVYSNDVLSKHAITSNGKNIDFETPTLIDIDDVYILYYEVTNKSRNFDASVTFKLNSDVIGLVDISYDPKEMKLLAGETKEGYVAIALNKPLVEDNVVNITLSLNATAIERDSLGIDYNENVPGMMMKRTSNTFWDYEETITHVVFENSFTDYETELKYDASALQDESVKAYLVENGETVQRISYYTSGPDGEVDVTEIPAHTLYIQGNEKIYANFNSSGLFENFENLIDIKGLEFLDTSRTVDMSKMFNWCRNINELDLSGFDTSNVINMSDMFKGCESLDVVNLNSFDTSNVTDMSDMFYSCECLDSLDLSSFDTSNVTRMSFMFYDCRSLNQLNLSNFNTRNVTTMADMFSGCNRLSLLNVSSFDTSKVISTWDMFYRCSSLTELDLSSFDTNNMEFMSGMFSDCTELKTLNVNNFLISKTNDIDKMFYNCKNLTAEITILGEKYDFRSTFEYAAINSGKIIVNYSYNVSVQIDEIIETKSSNSNVVKGIELANYNINIPSDVATNYTKASLGEIVSLESLINNKYIFSFKVNGDLIEGDTFTMVDKDVTITDVEYRDCITIESEHNPYQGSIDSEVFYENTFEGAKSITVKLTYETSDFFTDWIEIYDNKYSNMTADETRYAGIGIKKLDLVINSDYIRIEFKSDDVNNDFYGFKASIIPNY